MQFHPEEGALSVMSVSRLKNYRSMLKYIPILATLPQDGRVQHLLHSPEAYAQLWERISRRHGEEGNLHTACTLMNIEIEMYLYI